MKEFERWWQYDAPNAPNAREGWKAALEWALKNETNIGFSIPAVPTDIIRRELEQ